MAQSKQDQLLGFYKTLLTLLGVTVDDKNALTGQGHQPITIEGKRVYLPTRDVLKNLDNNIVGFHPLCENVFEGLSPMATLLRKLAMCYISDTVALTVYTLLKVAANKSLHKGMTAQQTSIISNLAGVDDKLIEQYEKLVNNLDVDKSTRLVNMVLRHKSLEGDEQSKSGRSCLVTFPLWDALMESTDGVVFDVKFRKKDLGTLREALKIVLPDIDKEGAYSAGSNSPVAPYFISLIKSLLKLVETTNSTTWKFRSLIADNNHGNNLHVGNDILEPLLNGIDNLADITSAVRPLPYNMGDKKDVATTIKDEDLNEEVKSAIGRAIESLSRSDSRESKRARDRDEEYTNRTDVRSEPIGMRREDSRERRSRYAREYSRGFDREDDRDYRGYGRESYREERYSRGNARGFQSSYSRTSWHDLGRR